MKTYVINVVVNTKTTDLYDRVAINKYPLIVKCKDENELLELLSSKDTQKWIKENVKTKRLFYSAYYFIREITNECEFMYKISDIVNVNY